MSGEGGVKTGGKEDRQLALAGPGLIPAELAVAFGPSGCVYRHWLGIMAGRISYNAFMTVFGGGTSQGVDTQRGSREKGKGREPGKGGGFEPRLRWE